MKFFDDPGMDFSVRCLLSGVRDGTAEVGEILATLERIDDGDANSWLDEFCGLGRRLVVQAEQASGSGRSRTAWGQSLRAANYLFGGAWWAPATHRSSEVDALWQQHRHAWDLAVSLWPTPARAEPVPSPVGDLPGYRFEPDRSKGSRGVVLMVQGLDTPLSDAAMTGLSEGLRRGWEVALVEGPGQGAALLRDGLTLADRWQGVVAAAAEWAQADSANPLVAMGVNHGSWFVLDAMIDGFAPHAAVLDPGVTDLASDQQGAAEDPTGAAKLLMATGADTIAESLAVIDRYRLAPSALGAVRVPTFVAQAESAESFAGQSELVADHLGGEVRLERFSDAAGAGLDCEIAAPQVRNAAVYDWLDATVGS